MIKNWPFALDKLMISEGGFTDDPHDKGNQLPDGRPGSTMLGVTQAEWERYVGHQVTHDDMKKLTKADVAPLYKKKYWDAVRADELPNGIDYLVFDAGVNTGPARAIRFLQSCVGVPVDGVLGPVTLAAAKAMNPLDLIQKYSDQRLQVYKTYSDFNRWGAGWTSRINRVANDASKLTQAA